MSTRWPALFYQPDGRQPSTTWTATRFRTRSQVAVYKKFVNGTFNLENDLVKPWNTKEALVATSTYATYGGEREMVSAGIEYIVVRISYLLINGYDAWTELFAFQGIAGESEQRWAKQFRVD